MHNTVYPFAAIVGQDELKLALILNAINPNIGGVLIRGEKGTAKSTAVRALAQLLPEIKVVEGCPYSCDPDDLAGMCETCARSSPELPSLTRRVNVVTLPLNATEDRVIGGIDFHLAVKQGARVLQPGLLAKAHRGILYVDEVNLLDDHLVDIILDAAASGENRVEREGISWHHPTSFILVGTMNPEEGELRPQLLDRFGLCVDVSAEMDADNRVLLMQRREAFDTHPQHFIKHFEHENALIAMQILKARESLKCVRLPKHLRTFISELCTQNCVAGHRADLVIEQAAKALTAYYQRSEVTSEDISRVASLALAHRRRDPLPPPPPPPEPPEQEQPTEPESTETDSNSREGTEQAEKQQDSQNSLINESKQSVQETEPDPHPRESQQPENSDVREQIFEVGQTFKVRKITVPKDRLMRRGSGRRSRTRTAQKQGRYIKSMPHRDNNDIALDATLRAAAPYQRHRDKRHHLAIQLRDGDLREKIREKRIGNFLLFLVDASGSMRARGRMAASKGAIMSLLLDAYQKRDRVAMISFRKHEAFLNLPPTSSIDLAGKLLQEMPVGGRTPLSAGLVKGFDVLRNYLLRNPTARPIVLIITDGKTNVALGEQKPIDEALELSVKMSLDDRIQFIVVDTEEPGLVSFELAGQLAATLNARYFKIDDLKAEQLLEIVRNR